MSYARVCIRIVSQPFCVDKFNLAGFNIPYKKKSRFFPARENGNLKTNLSSTTFTASLSIDSDYDNSTEVSSLNENENTYTEVSSDDSSSDPEINAKILSPQEFNDEGKVKPIKL